MIILSDDSFTGKNYIVDDNVNYLIAPLEHLLKKLTNLKQDEKLQNYIPDILTADLEKNLAELRKVIEGLKSGDPNKIPRFEYFKNFLTMALNSYLSDMEKSEKKIKRTLTTDFPLSREYTKEKEKIIDLMKQLEIERQSTENYRF